MRLVYFTAHVKMSQYQAEKGVSDTLTPRDNAKTTVELSASRVTKQRLYSRGSNPTSINRRKLMASKDGT